MRLHELRKPQEIDDIKKAVSDVTSVDSRNRNWMYSIPDILSSTGFKLAGTGNYGSVFVNDKYPFALKIFMKDSAYIKWLSFCKKNQNNPFVPKMKGGLVKITDIIFAVRIEKLNNFQGDLENTSFYQSLFKCLQNSNEMHENQHVKTVVEELCRNKHLLDLHRDNVMQRNNGQLVIIDPYYNWYNKSANKFTIDPDKIEF